MDYSFPYSIATLTTGGGVPTNGTPVHARDFNRLFSETTALESAIGKNPQGNKTDLKTRLAVKLNDDGTYKKELVCEDDPSGNARGTTRFMWMDERSVTSERDLVIGLFTDLFLRLPYTTYPSPPVCLFSIEPASSFDNMERLQISFVSEVGVVVDARTNGGGSPGAAHAVTVTLVAISRDLQVWEDDVPWAIPPVRTGS